MLGFPVLHISQNLLKFMSIEVVMPSNHLILCYPFFSCPQSFPASGCFPMSQFYASGGQNIGASVSASVLPKNIQDWFLLRLTGLISLQSKGFKRVFSSTIVRKHQFFGAQLFFYCPVLTSVHQYLDWFLTIQTFVGKIMSLFFNMLSRFVLMVI